MSTLHEKKWQIKSGGALGQIHALSYTSTPWEKGIGEVFDGFVLLETSSFHFSV